MLLLNMSRVQQAVVLRHFLRFSDPKKICLKYTDFSTTYLSAQLPRNTYYFKDNQIIQTYTENTLHRRKIKMVNARLLVQQFTHPVHPNSSYRLSYLLPQFVDKTGKICNWQQTKHKGQNKQDYKKNTRWVARNEERLFALFCLVLIGDVCTGLLSVNECDIKKQKKIAHHAAAANQHATTMCSRR